MDDNAEYYYEESETEERDSNNGSIYWGIVIGVTIASLVWGIGKNGKYEGQTAEDWFNEYDYCESKLQTYQECAENAIPNIVYYCSP